MRGISLLLLGATLASCTAAPPQPMRSARAQAQYSQLLAGKCDLTLEAREFRRMNQVWQNDKAVPLQPVKINSRETPGHVCLIAPAASASAESAASTMRAGLPATTTPSGTSLMTTAPKPTTL